MCVLLCFVAAEYIACGSDVASLVVFLRVYTKGAALRMCACQLLRHKLSDLNVERLHRMCMVAMMASPTVCYYGNSHKFVSSDVFCLGNFVCRLIGVDCGAAERVSVELPASVYLNLS